MWSGWQAKLDPDAKIPAYLLWDSETLTTDTLELLKRCHSSASEEVQRSNPSSITY